MSTQKRKETVIDLETSQEKVKRERREKEEQELNKKAEYFGTGCKYF